MARNYILTFVVHCRRQRAIHKVAVFDVCQRRNRMDSKPAVENGSYSGGFSSKDSLKILIPFSVF